MKSSYLNNLKTASRKFRHRLLIFLLIIWGAENHALCQLVAWNPGYSVGTITGKYDFSYNQVPDQIVELNPPWLFPPLLTTGAYQWQSSTVPVESGFTDISGAQSSNYVFSQPLQQTTYFRRRSFPANSPFSYRYSNIIKISVVSVNWEDLNYIREHEVNVTAVTDWKTVDQLPIGQKTQFTTYIDGLGRPIEKVDKGAATPATSGGAWGDMVQVYQYDQYGRQPTKYLPYTTTTESGKFKSAPLTEQPQYYTNVYNETSAFNSISFDNSPLNRIVRVNQSGAKWAASSGSVVSYDANTAADNVQIWGVDYTQGDAPVNKGAYAAGTLYKNTYTDVNQVKFVEYTDVDGRLILKKTQLDPAPSAAHAGWVCTYSVYDDFGQLCFQIQPEGVKYLDANSWSFAGANGPTVLAEQVFQYNYDDKGRTIWKKSPGAAPLNMLYDIRDRAVFLQDGNQAALTTPQWTANLYDDLDRATTTVLYNTTESRTALQTDINNAVTASNVTIPGYPLAPADLVYDQRNTGVTSYVASHSISFVSDAGGSFQSVSGDSFTAQIDLTTSATATTTVTTLASPISATNLANTAVCTIVKYLYYDDYTFSGAKTFDNNYTNTTAYSTSDPNVLPIASSLRVTSMPTGISSRVLGTNTFLGTTMYYDDKGNTLQTLEDNIKGGVDITTFQHHFDGRLLSTCNSHSAPGTGYTAFITLTKYLFDQINRVTSIQEQYGSNAMKTVSTTDYDDMGRVKTSHLDPGYNNPNSGAPDLESLNYSFNIHNQIVGINKDYALKTAASYNKWGHFFGLCLGYDNKDNAFTSSQLNGQVAGQLWNTQGDDAQRKYEYTYDNAGRLINAAFGEQQHLGDGWSTAKTDFSVSGTSGQITYDLNGNLLTMLQKGVLPGTSSPVVIDDLRYAYMNFSNKLKSVTDQMTLTSFNGQSGDFKDGTNAAGTADYVYDNDGNVVIDLNKNVQSLNNGAAGTNGISYNFLDKPEQIRIVGKGTIKIVYDADGEKLQRVFIPEAGGNSTITTYIGDFVYQETAALTISSPAPFAGTGVQLSYITFEEGRIRVMTPTTQGNGLDGLTENGNITLPNSQMGVWDYFIRDYQQNVRMILTEETHSAVNTCTMETTNGRPAAEDPVFGQTGTANEVETTRYPTPTGWQSVNTSSYVSHLGNLSGHVIGPNTLQKVMAGDQVTASVQYYYQSGITNSNPNIVPNVLNSLAGALAGGTTAGTIVHGNGAAITTQLSGNPAFVSAVEPTGAGGTTPQAFLTILFFDERFNLISATDGGMAQQQVASSWTSSTTPLGLSGIKAPKNGYVYVYVSNRSDQDVYFDNFAVGITAGNIIEEDHYYAYGLKIAGISSKKLGSVGEGTLKNNYLYNDKELYDDADLDWYDYGFRNYDPQIGRFVQLDPLTDDYPHLTPYQYASCDPIGNVDEDGLEGSVATSAAASVTVATTGAVTDAAENTAIAAEGVSTHVIVVVTATKIIHHAPTALSVTGNFIKGIGQSLWGTVTAVGTMVVHPITFVSGVVHAVANPIQTARAIGNAVQNTYNEFKNGDGNTRANILGHLAGDVGQIFIGTAEAKAVKEAEEVAVVGKAAEEGEILAKTSRAEGAIAKTKVPCGCFLPGTLVLTDKGYKPIEQIKPGDIVWSYNDTTGQYDKKKVVRIFQHIRDTIYKIYVGDDVISATSDHPFFVGGRWLRVVQLHIGDSVLTYSGGKLVIRDIKLIAKRTTVHNFEVAGYHTYYVSKERVLVHNNGPCDLLKRGGGAAQKGKTGVYTHTFENAAGEEVSYVGQAKDLGVRPRRSLSKLIKSGRANGLKYKGTIMKELKNATKEGLDKLEGKILKAKGGPKSESTLNINSAPNQP